MALNYHKRPKKSNKIAINLGLCQNRAMNIDQIRQKIINYLDAYRKNIGVFNGMVVIHDFVEYIQTEPYALAIIKPYLSYVQEQTTLAEANIDVLGDFKQTLNQEQFAKMPMFKSELTIVQQAIADNKLHELKPAVALPIYLSGLLLLHKLIASLPTASKERLEKASELPSINMLINEIMPGKNIIMPTALYFGGAMGAVAKEIINAIDKEHYLNQGKASQSLSFDQALSELYVKSFTVKIKRRSDPSIDHYILIALFGQESLGDPIEFYTIAEKTMADLEYNRDVGWSKFRSACDKLNQKVDKSTKGEIPDFIQYTTGRKGWCKINPNYL